MIWDVVPASQSDDLHVVPVADLIEHQLTDDCACGPTCEPVPRDDGTIGWVYTHHSLDGREATESPRKHSSFHTTEGNTSMSIKLPFNVSHAVQVVVAILSAVAAVGTQTLTALTGIVPANTAAILTSILATIAAIAGFIQKAEPLIDDATAAE